MSEEGFFKDIQALSFLKLRLGWGITGQQDIYSDYPYIANYSEGTSTAQYLSEIPTTMCSGLMATIRTSNGKRP